MTSTLSSNPYEPIFRAQKALFRTGVTRTREWRLDQLARMERMVGENEAELQDAVKSDFKTAPQEYVLETQSAIGEVAIQRSQLDEWMKPVEAPVPKPLAATGHRAVIYRDPYGVALIIGPFNGPLTLLLRPAIAALTAGNTCILKLSNALIRTSEVLLRLIPRYFEEQSVAVIAGGREANTSLLQLPFDFIFFTGSTKVGKIVAKAAAEHLTPVLLELGGQNPAIVDGTGNIADAARKIVWGAMAWGGQWCTSPGYAYVHESVAKEFVAEAKRALVEMFGKDPKNNPDYSRIVGTREAQRLHALIDQSKVVAGGDADPEARYVAPTILYPITWDDEIMDDEIFGPILPILTYTNLDEALARIADKPAPLAAFIFSAQQDHIDRFIGNLSYGGGAVNQVNIHLFIESMPFGGVGPAGMGHYYGRYGFKALTHAKSMLIAPDGVAIDHLFPPYDRSKVEALSMWFDYPAA
ncbi:aldehyde dehydrogenase family protein [Dyella soli]|uniref:Aldehyde dehydrogenase n=1 Tax=Dyella soli TaxID=522319 RepID=A0A4R0YT55_9GAMM|nr:aldehyde dehydrogenase family protein [Dyella soli]TCI09662.1 aldehyde dehydrogenase family protein [Dyella soli]